MTIYLATKSNIVQKTPRYLYAQLGYGFYANGSVRLPHSVDTEALCIIDDLYLPNMTNSALQLLKAKIKKGCILDFERQASPIHKRLVHALSDKKIIALPEVYHDLSPKSLSIVCCNEPCNHWEQFCRKQQSSHPNGWMLQLSPWNTYMKVAVPSEEGFLKNAICRFRKENDQVLYYDTRQTLHQKLIIAQNHGCKATIALYEEVKKL